jgi:protein-disulfide isomerase
MMSTKKFIEKRRKKNKRQKNLMLAMMIGGSVIMVGALLAAILTSGRVRISQKELIQSEVNPALNVERNVLGSPSAPVVIEEYSDFGCTFCADFALGNKKIIEESYITNGQVRLVFHSVGGLLKAPATFQAAEAAYCAADQNAFWPYHDLIFINQLELFQNRSADITPALKQIAAALELDQDQFILCLENGTYQDLVAADELNARQNGITGTPAFLINGVVVHGNQPLETFQQLIDEELAKAGL